MNGSAPILELIGISKSFGGVAALKEVDFALHSREIHGLVGQNGAGKSTLMKIIAGVHASYEGTMRLDGQAARFASAHDARAAGVGMVYQELSIVPDLTVAENVLLGQQPTGRLGVVDWRRMSARPTNTCAVSALRSTRAPAPARCRSACSSSSRSAASCFLERASSSSMSRPPLSRRPKLSTCSRCCAGCATPAEASCSFLTLSTTC